MEEDKEQQQVNALLQKPEVRAALQDPQVQALMAAIREGKGAEVPIMARMARDERLRRHIEVLYKNGLLGVARNVPSSS